VARRVIAHLDLDAFFASVELRRRPELVGLPVIISGSHPRAVVMTATYEARRYGVGSAMPTSRARRLCPQAVLVPPDMAAYSAASAEVFAILREEVAEVEKVGMDEGYLDITSDEKPMAAMRALKATIHERTGLTCSIGIGPNRLVAKVCSGFAKPGGLLALSSDQACERFAQEPVTLVPGIGPRTAERLGEMGITTLDQLRAAGEERLRARFGDNHGGALLRRAHFLDETPLHARPRAVSASTERTFETDIADMAELQETLTRLAQSLCEGMRKRERRGRNIAIKVRLSDFTTVTRARSIAQHTNDPAVVADVACALLREYSPAKPVRLLGVRLAAFEGEAQPAAPDSQLSLAV
jgi:DNA polymerase-4